MNITKKMLIFVSFVAAMTTGVMLYYAGDRENVQEEKEVVVRNRMVEKEPAIVNEEKFRVILEGGRVILYRIDGEDKTEMDSVEIDADYYPREDIMALTEGITAYTVEEGYSILENFAN